jgi:hypothetical protein
MVPSLLALVICLFLSGRLSAQEITDIKPDSANVSDPVTILGKDFGEKAGTVSVGDGTLNHRFGLTLRSSFLCPWVPSQVILWLRPLTRKRRVGLL